MKLFLISPYRAYATHRLLGEASNQGIELTVREIKQLIDQDFDINPSGFDALYIRQAYRSYEPQVQPEYLSKLVDLAQRFKDAGKVVVDQSLTDDDLSAGKYESLMRLQEQGIVTPPTIPLKNISKADLSETDIFSATHSRAAAVASVQKSLGQHRLIAKWNYGFGAKHTYLINSMSDLKKVQDKYRAEEILIQEFVPADFEYKVITVGYQSLPIIIKLATNRNKFLPDFNSYQLLAPSDIPPVAALAQTSAKILKRELAKVDILQASNQLYVLEVNRWPGLQYFEKTTHYNVAADFLRYIQTRL